MAYKENVVSDKVMDVGEARAVAMYLEAEGSIALHLRKPFGLNVREAVVAVIDASNTRVGQLEELVRLTGNGRIDEGAESREGRKALYKWKLGGNQIRHVLPQVLPYLVTKKRQAEIVVTFLSLRGNHADGRVKRGWALADQPIVKVLYDEIRLLNKRGDCIGREFVEVEGKTEKVSKPARICREDDCNRICYRSVDQCYNHWFASKPTDQRPCERCGSIMEIRDAKRRFCSDKCQWQSAYEKREHRKIGQVRHMLTEAKVRQIVDRYNIGTESAQQIADAYGSDRGTIQKILTGKTWGHLLLDLPNDTSTKGDRHWSKRNVKLV